MEFDFFEIKEITESVLEAEVSIIKEDNGIHHSIFKIPHIKFNYFIYHKI
jgi:hypothetical protein